MKGRRGVRAAAAWVAVTVVAALGALLPSHPAAAQEAPGIVNAELRFVEATADVASTLADLVSEAPSPSWIAYEVAAVPGQRHMCCWRDDEGGGICSLEGRGGVHGSRRHEPTPLESRLRVLLRVVDGRVQRLRMFTPDCTLDAGGLPVAWVRGVATGGSLAALSELVEGRGALGRLAATADVAGEAVGAASLHDTPEAVDALVQAARGHASGKVRSQALFWLAQRAGERAAATIEGAVETDPDLEVRKRAVFALGQLPADRGVPLLIRIARTHAQPEVRKQAVFWLGQSGDPRALEFIEALLRG